MGFLVEYELQIEYIKGKENKVVDTLSWKRHTLSAISNYKIDVKGKDLQYQSHDKFCSNQKERIR